VLLSPMINSEAVPGNTHGTVLVQARWVEAGETQLAALNLSELINREPDQPFTGKMDAEELKALIEALESTEGVDILSAPRIQTSSGVQGSISVTEQKVINGESHVLGPAIDLLPHITENGDVEMTVVAALTLEE
jgi:type II secretory pathway component GspD/PulD (secretin)